MQQTLESLQDELIRSFEILDFNSGKSSYFLKIMAVISDGSLLQINEYSSLDDYLYSDHWQGSDGSLRIRWDNSPHHRNLRTFPDNKHAPELMDSKEMCLADALDEIRTIIKKE
jgi:hypothetical protein